MSNPSIDFKTTEQFLGLFAPPNHPFDWRILKHQGGGQKLRGTLDEVSDILNFSSQQRDQIFFMANKSDGQGQSAHNIVRVRALFADLDGVPLENLHRFDLQPHILLETSPGKFHAYWLVKEVPLDRFTDLQKRLAHLISSDPVVCDLPRIMRVPGTFHCKGTPFQSRLIQVNEGSRYTLEQIESNLPATHITPAPADYQPYEKIRSFSLERGLPDGRRTEALTHLAGVLIAQGAEDSEALGKLYSWNTLNDPPLSTEKIVNTYESLKRTHSRNHSDEALSIEDLKQNYAVVVSNGSTKILRKSPSLCFMSERDFHLRHRQHRVVDQNGKTKRLSQVFLSGPHPTYDDVIFDPSNQHAPYEYNLWKGFAIEAVAGECQLYLDHVRDCICNGDETLNDYVLNWMAHLVQKPAELPGVALVLIGDQGTGKGSFVEPLGQMLGDHYQHATQMDKVLGRFNMHMAHALLVFCDEIVWGGNKKDEGALKGLVTERDRLVEGKFQNPLTLPSYLRLIFATNEAWAVPTGEKERRWCVLNVNNNHIQDTEYFRALKTEMANGGVEALMDFLLARDITNFDVRRVPKTRGLLDQKLMSQDSVATWWYDRLSQGELGCSPDRYYIATCLEFDSFNQTHQILNEYLHSVKYDRYGHGRVINGQQLIQSMKRMCHIELGRKQVDGSRQRGVFLPPLADCRAQYEAFIGHGIDWPE